MDPVGAGCGFRRKRLHSLEGPPGLEAQPFDIAPSASDTSGPDSEIIAVGTVAVYARVIYRHGDRSHLITLEAVIETIRQTVADISDQ